MNKKLAVIVLMLLLVTIVYMFKDQFIAVMGNQDETVYTLVVPTDRFPETAAHIKTAEEHGKTSVCTIDRKGAEGNRKESLKGVPTKPNKDRDEFPMAMCAEGGKGADIAYITPSDNRGAGSWIGNQLDRYPDGTRVLVVVK
ncbi:DNA-entry nuclease [Paenibacillus pectinilyticus]|uniref:DNA-entry nuclease n=1 Tax=Paenibacillus pectinilyticus TaxID=512399 RepID=A0A1C1A744_9BACL|nr:NucA/NucB deoxyribonuclease domain-containing protein [Paenibacillus pectinilyticus]OCT16385.1 DNA-entry nuclease [Paenibacillus pectinilyticus]